MIMKQILICIDKIYAMKSNKIMHAFLEHKRKTLICSNAVFKTLIPKMKSPN